MIKEEKRNSRTAALQPYCHMAKEYSEMEVTEWTNGEGIDVSIHRDTERSFNLTYGELTALIVLANYRGE